MNTISLPIADTPLGRQFAEDGYYLAKSVYSKEEVARLEEGFDRIVAQILASGENVNARWGGAAMESISDSSVAVLHTHNVQQYSADWAKALFHPRFLEAATAILGTDMVLHHSKLFQKPSETGAPFPMHQDWSYFPTVLDSMIAGIIHISRATDEMGCLRVYPGSHKLGRLPETSGSKILKDYPLDRATVVEAEPGDVLFFHYFTIHGSMPNRSSAVRKTVLVQMLSGQDCVEEGNQHPNERLVLSGWNHHATRDRAGRAN